MYDHMNNSVYNFLYVIHLLQPNRLLTRPQV